MAGQGRAISRSRSGQCKSRAAFGRNASGLSARLTQKGFVKGNARAVGKPLNFFEEWRTQLFDQGRKAPRLLTEFLAGLAREFFNPQEVLVNEARGLPAVLIAHVVRAARYFDKGKCLTDH